MAARTTFDRRGDPTRRFLPWIIAFMVFLAVLATAAAIIVTSAVDRWGQELAGTLTVQIPPAADGAEATQATVDAVAGLLRATPGVAEARVFDAAESRALLDPWLGIADGDTALPLPRLIDVRLRGGTNLDVEALRRSIRGYAPGAVVDDHSRWLGELTSLIRSVQLSAAAVVGVIAVAAALTVVYATRSGIEVHHPTIEVLHLIGATDAYIAGRFQRQALLLGLAGGALGYAAAALVLIVAGRVFARVEVTTLPTFTLSTEAWIALACVPLAGALISTMAARFTVTRSLRRML